MCRIELQDQNKTKLQMYASDSKPTGTFCTYIYVPLKLCSSQRLFLLEHRSRSNGSNVWSRCAFAPARDEKQHERVSMALVTYYIWTMWPPGESIAAASCSPPTVKKEKKENWAFDLIHVVEIIRHRWLCIPQPGVRTRCLMIVDSVYIQRTRRTRDDMINRICSTSYQLLVDNRSLAVTKPSASLITNILSDKNHCHFVFLSFSSHYILINVIQLIFLSSSRCMSHISIVYRIGVRSDGTCVTFHWLLVKFQKNVANVN